MTVFAPSLGALWRQLEAYGIDPEKVFREQGVDPEILFDAGARIPLAQYLKLDLKAAELSGDEHFGLKGAEYFRPAHLGALGFAWLASSSLRSGFQRMSRYARVINEKLTITLDEVDGLFVVTVDAQLPSLQQRTREDGQLAAIVKFCRVIAGQSFNPARVCFRHETPDNTAYYYELFRCPVEFKSGHTQFFISLQAVDKRLTGSNIQLAELNEHIIVKYLAHNEKNDIVNRTKAAIIDGLSTGAVTAKITAEALHMTPRNLHRKLHREGSSFKRLLAEIRKELARQYIQDRSKTLTEISYLLGYSETSSFSRAYRSWTGHSPSKARQN